MGDVVRFTGITTLDLDPDLVLEAAKGQLEDVTIIGYDKEGREYFASSVADGGKVTWMLERAKYKLMKITDEMSGD